MSQRYPALIHPVVIELEQIDRGATFFDPDTREPIQQAARKVKVSLLGQPRIRSQPELSMDSRGGDNPESSGYVLFRKRDLDALNITLDLNDRIVKIGHLDVEVFIDRLEWIGQLQNYDGPTLVKAWFTDRRPSQFSEFNG